MRTRARRTGVADAAAAGLQPAYDRYFADPFVWRHGGEWFAVGTGPAEAAGAIRGSHVFPLLRSTDFRTWRSVGAALARPAAALGDSFWAPEVACADGGFHLYYSVGFGDAGHHLRVAQATLPQGPYRDVGALTDPARCRFAIDPHPFRDRDGTWWLFHARDFLDADDRVRAGTALVAQRLEGMTRLAPDPPVVVLRAHHDWQRFRADRPLYGRRFDWHTLEGPCVRRHAGRYWCLYSAGRWDSATYGVDYAVADAVTGPWSDAGSERGPRLLRTIPRHLIGPGHTSIVEGPDDVEQLAFHAWDVAMHARRMFLAPLRWQPDGPRIALP
jgi:hypothetical protein